jgi:hypothetical protein
MVERSLSMREAPGSIPGLSIFVFTSFLAGLFVVRSTSVSKRDLLVGSDLVFYVAPDQKRSHTFVKREETCLCFLRTRFPGKTRRLANDSLHHSTKSLGSVSSRRFLQRIRRVESTTRCGQIRHFNKRRLCHRKISAVGRAAKSGRAARQRSHGHFGRTAPARLPL